MRIGVLAVQGAFVEHAEMIKKFGHEAVEIRKPSHLSNIEGIILPGGESTVQTCLLNRLHMTEILQEKIQMGLPVLATCSGLILLAEKLDNDNLDSLKTMPVSVKRNAYGRQVASFVTSGNFSDMEDVPMVFIRAPYITEVGSETEVLAEYKGNVVAAKYKNQLGLSFHPELTEDTRIHRYFVDEMCK